MTEKLTYEQWRKHIGVTITDEARVALKEIHNLDVDAEVESALRQEYEVYLNEEEQ